MDLRFLRGTENPLKILLNITSVTKCIRIFIEVVNVKSLTAVNSLKIPYNDELAHGAEHQNMSRCSFIHNIGCSIIEEQITFKIELIVHCTLHFSRLYLQST